MKAPFSARRRADEFEALLSRGPGTTLPGRDAERYADLLEVVADLQAVPPVTARPEFVSSLRQRLMAEAETALVRQPAARQRLAMPTSSDTRQRRVGTLLGGAALVGSAATMAVAAQTALPGESLYGVKRGIESAQVRLATDDADRGRTLLVQAGTRLTELEELAAGGAGRSRLVPDTLDSFVRQSSDGVRSLLRSYDAAGSIDDAQLASDFTAASMGRLERLQGELPESTRDDLLAAARTLLDLDLEVRSACRACTGGITATPEFLLASAAPPTDLVVGLRSEPPTPEGAPVSGQDRAGTRVNETRDPQQVVPPTLPTTTLGPGPATLGPGPATLGPGPAPVVPQPTSTGPAKPEPTKPVKDITKLPDPVTETTDPVIDGATETTDPATHGATGGPTDTVGTLTGQLGDATGGALGGLPSDAGGATGGLVGEVTGTVDGASGGTLGNATGGLLP